MPFDFDLKATCNHIVDGIQYWGFDNMDANTRLQLNTDSKFKNKFFKTMAYRICPRCDGKGWYWDIHFDQTANNTTTTSPVLVRGRTKLKQDLTKFFITIQGDCLFHMQYGVGYQRFIGKKFLPETTEFIKMQTILGFDYLVSLYIQQATYQYVDGTEMAKSITDLQMSYDPSAPSTFFIRANVLTGSDEPLDASYVVTMEPAMAIDSFNSDVVTFERIG